jgi:hypothetical protein
MMARKTRPQSFDQILASLRADAFDVTPFAGAAGGVLVSKNGAGAVLVPATASSGDEAGVAAAFFERPGVLIGGQVARLLDRGYQKFLKTSQYEFPATAQQLEAIHRFSEALSRLTGAISLYNEALGTTSDLYQYDRLQGRDAHEHAPVQPWQLGEGH